MNDFVERIWIDLKPGSLARSPASLASAPPAGRTHPSFPSCFTIIRLVPMVLLMNTTFWWAASLEMGIPG